MRLVLLALVLSASAAFADVPTPFPKARCSVPSGCVSCFRRVSDADGGADCRAGAVDAGLVLSDCADHTGSGTTEYLCPPGHPAVAGCGCTSTEGLAVLAVVALAGLLRRRR